VSTKKGDQVGLNKGKSREKTKGGQQPILEFMRTATSSQIKEALSGEESDSTTTN